MLNAKSDKLKHTKKLVLKVEIWIEVLTALDVKKGFYQMMELLAGITIVALSGENGILRQAVKAKDKTEIAEIIDKAQVDVLGV